MPGDPVRIGIVGDGALHSAVLRRLEPGTYAVIDRAGVGAPPGGLVVAIHDDGQLERDVAIQRATRAAGARLLHVRLDGPLAVVGPTVEPARPGCVACAELRRRAVARLPLRTDLRRGSRHSAEHTVPFVEAAAEIAAEVVRSRRALPAQAFVLQAADLTGQWHSFLPVASCRECGALPDDAARAPWFERRGVEPAVPGGFRERELPNSDAMRRHLLDWRYGLVPHVFRVQGNAPLAMSGSQFTKRDATHDAGWGRATSYARAEAIAFFEAMERHACLEPRDRRLVVRAPLAALGDRALDPRALGVRDPDVADRLPRGWRMFSDDLEISWVWGHSLTADRPILVPAQCVYYGRLPGEPHRFIQETSNGAASGASLQEALLHGLFEIIERDAFLLTWYGQLPVPEIAVGAARDREIGRLLDQAESRGYRVHLFDATMDLEVTTVWALAVARGGDLPRSFSAAGAHPDPEQAVLGALREVVPDALLYQRKPEHGDEALRRMLREPEQVRTLEDHVALYTLPEAFERLAFLWSGRSVPLAAVAPGWRDRWARATLDDSLAALVAHLADRGLEVIAVEVTAPEQRALGQRSVKLLVPGTLPMTFGDAHRRTSSLPRLLEVPHRLGYWPRPRSHAELALHPHPFP